MQAGLNEGKLLRIKSYSNWQKNSLVYMSATALFYISQSLSVEPSSDNQVRINQLLTLGFLGFKNG